MSHTRRVAAPEGLLVRRCCDLAGGVDPQAHPPRTSVEGTVLDLAPDGTADEAVALAAFACQQGLTWGERLLERLEQRSRQRWRALLRDALRDIGEGSQSAMEVRYVRGVERPHGQPPGRRQQPTGVGRRRHDVGYEEQRMIVELDGLAFHGSARARANDGRRDRGTLVERWVTLRTFWADVAVTRRSLAHEVGAALTGRGWGGAPRRRRRRGCVLRAGTKPA